MTNFCGFPLTYSQLSESWQISYKTKDSKALYFTDEVLSFTELLEVYFRYIWKFLGLKETGFVCLFSFH